MCRLSVICFLLALTLAACSDDRPTGLVEYVESPDDAYAWEVVSQEGSFNGSTRHELRMTSQIWRSEPWEHLLGVVTPEQIASDPTTVLLIIGGDGDGDESLEIAALLASSIGTPVAVLHDVPNQPLLDGLREDALIAETFVRYLDTGDPLWPILLPMTKSAVRAMDAVEAFLEDQDVDVGGFVVSGGSKRGWTTWLTGGVDGRVKAIVPISYDNLGLRDQMQHQLDSWAASAGRSTTIQSATYRRYCYRTTTQLASSHR